MAAQLYDPIASLQELLRFEESNLHHLRTQQRIEREIRGGKPEALDPDIRTCEEMIRIWTDRLNRERWRVSAA